MKACIYGIGNDVADIRRIRDTWQRRGLRFAQKILGPQEMLVFQHRLAKVESRGVAYLATRFSAKEAFSKAIGMGMHMPMTWRACQILNDPTGQPKVVLSGELLAWFEARHLHAHVSVSDEVEVAMSVVVVEQRSQS